MSAERHANLASMSLWTDGWCTYVAGGQDRLDYFKHVVARPKIYNTGAIFDFSGFTTGDLWIALVSFVNRICCDR